MIKNQEVSKVLRCIASNTNDICDIENCEHEKHKGLCMMILVIISTYKKWETEGRQKT